jgi:mannosyl-3-phosphoglycerate phosphatase
MTGNNHPFIVENGGAIVIPPGYFAFSIPSGKVVGDQIIVQLGDPYSEIVACLQDASAETACSVRGFHEMTVAEVAQISSLAPSAALLAKAREFDEPFLILDKDKAPALLAAIERKGKRWTEGGRFHHILGRNDKAAAVMLLLSIYRLGGRHVRSIGIGDGLNDALFLKIVDIPILIRTPWLHKLQAAVPNGIPTTSTGPRGWSEAIAKLFA